MVADKEATEIERDWHGHNQPYLFRDLDTKMRPYIDKQLLQRIADQEKKGDVVYHQGLQHLIKQATEQSNKSNVGIPVVAKLLHKEEINGYINTIIDPLMQKVKMAKQSKHKKIAKDLAARCVDIALALGQTERAVRINQSLNIYHDMVDVWTKAEVNKKFGDEAVVEWSSLGKRPITLCLANVAFGEYTAPKALQKYLSYYAEMISVQDALIIGTRRLGWEHDLTLSLFERWKNDLKKSDPNVAKLMTYFTSQLKELRDEVLRDLMSSDFDMLTAYRLVICTENAEAKKAEKGDNKLVKLMKIWIISLARGCKENLILSEQMAKDIALRIDGKSYILDVLTFFLAIYKLVLSADLESLKEPLCCEVIKLRHFKGGLEVVCNSQSMSENAILQRTKNKETDDLINQDLNSQVAETYALIGSILNEMSLEKPGSCRLQTTVNIANGLSKVLLSKDAASDASSLFNPTGQLFETLHEQTRKRLIEFILKDKQPFERPVLNERFKFISETLQKSDIEHLAEEPTQEHLDELSSFTTDEGISQSEMLTLLNKSPLPAPEETVVVGEQLTSVNPNFPSILKHMQERINCGSDGNILIEQNTGGALERKKVGISEIFGSSAGAGFKSDGKMNIGPVIHTCFRCGEKGHKRIDCRKNTERQSCLGRNNFGTRIVESCVDKTTKRTNKECYTCGGPHRADECPGCPAPPPQFGCGSNGQRMSGFPGGRANLGSMSDRNRPNSQFFAHNWNSSLDYNGMRTEWLRNDEFNNKNRRVTRTGVSANDNVPNNPNTCEPRHRRGDRSYSSNFGKSNERKPKDGY